MKKTAFTLVLTLASMLALAGCSGENGVGPVMPTSSEEGTSSVADPSSSSTEVIPGSSTEVPSSSSSVVAIPGSSTVVQSSSSIVVPPSSSSSAVPAFDYAKSLRDWRASCSGIWGGATSRTEDYIWGTLVNPGKNYMIGPYTYNIYASSTIYMDLRGLRIPASITFLEEFLRNNYAAGNTDLTCAVIESKSVFDKLAAEGITFKLDYAAFKGP